MVGRIVLRVVGARTVIVLIVVGGRTRIMQE